MSNSARQLMDSVARPGGISDELRHSFEQAALLAGNVDQSLSNIHIPAPTVAWSHEDLAPPTFRDLPALAPSPFRETNSHLSELADTVSQLVEVAKHQAELSQAIRSSTDLALKYAIQSGEDAKAATLLARRGVKLTSFAIVVAIIAALAGIAVSYHQNKLSDVGLKEEIRLLGDISQKLQQFNGQPVGDAIVTPKPQTKPSK